MKRAVVVTFLILTAAKLAVAAHLDLFGDEAFYWQCGQRPAIAYADHPPMTAMLVRLGSELLGDRPLGVRLLFLLAGAALPFAVFYLTRPLAGRRDAWWAAGASLALPGMALLGLLAIPDGPLLLFSALFLLGLERATRRGETRWWLSAGLAGAHGLATHYRFVLAPAAALLYLISRHGRRHWRTRGPWLMLAAMLPGLLPAVLYNLRHDFSAVRYFLGGRHGASPDLGAPLEHLAGQALIVTPLLYAALIGALVALCRRALAGDGRAALAGAFALTHLGVFFLASPFEDSGLVTVHWPLPGYLALLPYLPAALRHFAVGNGAVGNGAVGNSAAGSGVRHAGAALAPGLGIVVVVLLLAELGTGWPGLGSAREPFVGASQVTERSSGHLPEIAPGDGGRWLVVADNYKLAAQLELGLHAQADVYVLDHHKNHAHGRAPQLAEWGIDEEGLRRRAGEEALVVLEASQIRTGEHDAWIAHAGSFFARFEPLGELEVPSPGKRKKKKVFWFYRGMAKEGGDG